MDDDDLDDEEAAEGIQRPRDIALRATLELASGVAMCSVFSDPFVDALSHLSAASHVPPFFVGCDTCTLRALWHSLKGMFVAADKIVAGLLVRPKSWLRTGGRGPGQHGCPGIPTPAKHKLIQHNMDGPEFRCIAVSGLIIVSDNAKTEGLDCLPNPTVSGAFLPGRC